MISDNDAHVDILSFDGDLNSAIKLSPLVDSLMLSLMLFFIGVFIELGFPAVWLKLVY